MILHLQLYMKLYLLYQAKKNVTSVQMTVVAFFKNHQSTIKELLYMHWNKWTIIIMPSSQSINIGYKGPLNTLHFLWLLPITWGLKNRLVLCMLDLAVHTQSFSNRSPTTMKKGRDLQQQHFEVLNFVDAFEATIVKCVTIHQFYREIMTENMFTCVTGIALLLNKYLLRWFLITSKLLSP